MKNSTDIQIEPFAPGQLDAVVNLSLRAWAPVFDSIETSLPSAVYQAFYPQGWRASQKAAVKAVCQDAEMTVRVALVGDRVAGFVAIKIHEEDSMGEILMIAADPDHQRKGVASALTQHALGYMQEQGLAIAMVETGGDPGHAPARHLYEATGFTLWPVARYFREL